MPKKESRNVPMINFIPPVHLSKHLADEDIKNVRRPYAIVTSKKELNICVDHLSKNPYTFTITTENEKGFTRFQLIHKIVEMYNNKIDEVLASDAENNVNDPDWKPFTQHPDSVLLISIFYNPRINTYYMHLD
jgi:hypothetical protein